MTIIIENINSYFLDMYGKYENIDEEVRNMVKSFYDPRVEERGIEKCKREVAEKLFKKGININEIIDITELSRETVEKIKKI